MARSYARNERHLCYHSVSNTRLPFTLNTKRSKPKKKNSNRLFHRQNSIYKSNFFFLSQLLTFLFSYFIVMDKQLNLPINEPRWTRRMQQLLSTKLEQVERKTQTWIPSALQSKKRKPTKIHTTCGQHDMLNEKAYYHSISSLPQEQDKKAYPDESNSHCSASVSSDHEKDIVPLHQFLRYSMNRSEQRKFQRRRVLQPFKPVYEVEWQKNQWLQFDNQTNSQIERLKQEGFTKIAIRKDKILKRHVSYVNPKDMDVGPLRLNSLV